MLYLLLSEVILRMAGQFMKVGRPGGTLSQPVKQLHNTCCLAGHVLKGAHWGNVDNMKVPKNISSPFSLTYPNICVGS